MTITERRVPFTYGGLNQLPPQSPILNQNVRPLPNNSNSTRKLPNLPVKNVEMNSVTPKKSVINATVNPTSMSTSKPASLGISSFSAQINHINANESTVTRKLPTVPVKPVHLNKQNTLGSSIEKVQIISNSPSNSLSVNSNFETVKQSSLNVTTTVSTKTPEVSKISNINSSITQKKLEKPSKSESNTSSKSMFKNMLGLKDKKVKPISSEPSKLAASSQPVNSASQIKIKNSSIDVKKSVSDFPVFRNKILDVLAEVILSKEYCGNEVISNQRIQIIQRIENLQFNTVNITQMIQYKDLNEQLFDDIQRMKTSGKIFESAMAKLPNGWEKTGKSFELMNFFKSEYQRTVREINELNVESMQNLDRQKAVAMCWGITRGSICIDTIIFLKSLDVSSLHGKSLLTPKHQQQSNKKPQINNHPLAGKYVSMETGKISNSWFEGSMKVKIMTDEESETLQKTTSDYFLLQEKKEKMNNQYVLLKQEYQRFAAFDAEHRDSFLILEDKFDQEHHTEAKEMHIQKGLCTDKEVLHQEVLAENKSMLDQRMEMHHQYATAANDRINQCVERFPSEIVKNNIKEVVNYLRYFEDFLLGLSYKWEKTTQYSDLLNDFSSELTVAIILIKEFKEEYNENLPLSEIREKLIAMNLAFSGACISIDAVRFFRGEIL